MVGGRRNEPGNSYTLGSRSKAHRQDGPGQYNTLSKKCKTLESSDFYWGQGPCPASPPRLPGESCQDHLYQPVGGSGQVYQIGASAQMQPGPPRYHPHPPWANYPPQHLTPSDLPVQIPQQPVYVQQSNHVQHPIRGDQHAPPPSDQHRLPPPPQQNHVPPPHSNYQSLNYPPPPQPPQPSPYSQPNIDPPPPDPPEQDYQITEL